MLANLQYGWTMFVRPMHDRHGWSIAAIQVAFSIFIVTETWPQFALGWIVDRAPADDLESGRRDPCAVLVGIEPRERPVQLARALARDRVDQRVVRARQQFVDPRPLGLEMAGQQLQRPSTLQTPVASAHAEISSSDADRCRRLSATSTSDRRTRSRPSRSAIVCATRTTRWRPRALSAPAS